MWQAVQLQVIIAQMAAEKPYTDDDLLAYLDEMLPADRMSAIETQLRADEALRLRVAAVARRRDQGVHSVGEIWRRMRLSCPTRNQLGSFLLGTLDPALTEYIEFHLRSVGCRLCAANLDDLERSMKTTPETTDRRRRFFESSGRPSPRLEFGQAPLSPGRHAGVISRSCRNWQIPIRFRRLERRRIHLRSSPFPVPQGGGDDVLEKRGSHYRCPGAGDRHVDRRARCR